MNLDKPPLLDFEEGVQTRSPLEELLDAPMPASGHPASGFGPKGTGIVVGTIIGVAELPLVNFPGNPAPEPLPARHVCPIAAADIGREAVLVFESDDSSRPIILGLLHVSASAESRGEPVQVSLDGEQITLAAKNEIVLRCGKASITLTRAGKILIRGAYLLSRSSGVNRIKGGSVQIN